MMVHVFAHIIKVIVFAASTNALLCICSTMKSGHRVGWVNGVQEDGLELYKKKKKEFIVSNNLDTYVCPFL